MKTKSLAVIGILFLTGCATGPQPLRDMYYVADGWVVAAYEQKHQVHVHARKRAPVQYTNKPIRNNFQEKHIVVQYGDTLQSISQDEYGNPYMWDIIAMGNDLSLPYNLAPGSLLNIPLPESHTPTGTVVELDHWELRFVNSGRKDVCVKADFMDIDYHIDVQPGWYHIQPSQTLYIGTLTQEPWVLAKELYAFDDAKWVVNTIKVVPYKSETECAI